MGTQAQPTLLWMECGACSGESMAILGAEGRGKRGDTLPGFLEQHGVRAAVASVAVAGVAAARPPR